MSIPRLLLVSVLGLASAACASKGRMAAMRSGQGEAIQGEAIQADAMPVIRIAPGYVERIALMDRYRLHDETRHHMMARPRVWVEEVPEDEVPETPASPDEPAPPSAGP